MYGRKEQEPPHIAEEVPFAAALTEVASFLQINAFDFANSIGGVDETEVKSWMQYDDRQFRPAEKPTLRETLTAKRRFHEPLLYRRMLITKLNSLHALLLEHFKGSEAEVSCFLDAPWLDNDFSWREIAHQRRGLATACTALEDWLNNSESQSHTTEKER